MNAVGEIKTKQEIIQFMLRKLHKLTYRSIEKIDFFTVKIF